MGSLQVDGVPLVARVQDCVLNPAVGERNGVLAVCSYSGCVILPGRSREQGGFWLKFIGNRDGAAAGG